MFNHGKMKGFPLLPHLSNTSERHSPVPVHRQGQLWRQVVTVLALLLSLTLAGTVGLKIITNDSWVDCLYMAVITLTTVGFTEAVDLGTRGRVFIIVYLMFGLGVFTYSASLLGHWIVNVRLQAILERRRMENSIQKLTDHFIICGLGRMGAIIAENMHERGEDFVIVDRDEDRIAEFCDVYNWHYVLGDATDDETLVRAGIERAKSLASVLPTDADNVYVVLSARMLASKLQIIARADVEKAVVKLERAGATRVVRPFSTGAHKMARFMLHPNIEDFLEIADSRGHELELADVQITDDHPLVGKRLMDTTLREQGVMVIGIRREDGEKLMPPPGTAVIMAGDSLFAFGSAQAVNDTMRGGSMIE